MALKTWTYRWLPAAARLVLNSAPKEQRRTKGTRLAKKTKPKTRRSGEYAARKERWCFITLALTPHQHRRLAAMAKAREQSMTAVVRSMLNKL